MFISHNLSSEKKDNTRRMVNAYVAATASVKRRDRKNDAVLSGSNEVTVNLNWLHERPIILSYSRKEVDEERKSKVNLGPGHEEQKISGAGIEVKVAFDGKDRPINPRSERKRLVRCIHSGSIELPISSGFYYPVPKKGYYSSLLFQSQLPLPSLGLP
jgi:hypothetical protein